MIVFKAIAILILLPGARFLSSLYHILIYKIIAVFSIPFFNQHMVETSRHHSLCVNSDAIVKDGIIVDVLIGSR